MFLYVCELLEFDWFCIDVVGFFVGGGGVASATSQSQLHNVSSGRCECKRACSSNGSVIITDRISLK